MHFSWYFLQVLLHIIAYLLFKLYFLCKFCNCSRCNNNNSWFRVYSVQSLSHIVQVLDPEGNGSINFVQFSEGVKRILELQGGHFFIRYTSWLVVHSCNL